MTSTKANPNTLPVIGPLTTPFAQPTYCAFPHIRCDTGSTCFLTRDASCEADSKAHWGTQCYPGGTGAFTSYTDNGQVMSGPIYSPGAACPAGYEVVTAGQSANPSITNCCPSGYTMAIKLDYCYSNIMPPSGVTAAWFCTDHLTGVLVSITMAGSADMRFSGTLSGTTYTILGGGAVYGEPIRFISGTDNARSGGAISLSGGAIASIAIGALVFGIVIAVAGLALYRHRKRKEKAGGVPTEAVGLAKGEKAELPNEPAARHELDPIDRQELDSTPVGAGSNERPAELAANASQRSQVERTK